MRAKCKSRYVSPMPHHDHIPRLCPDNGSPLTATGACTKCGMRHAPPPQPERIAKPAWEPPRVPDEELEVSF
jgi:hypothetical protein